MNLKSILLLLFFVFYTILCCRYYVCEIKNLCPESYEKAKQYEHPIQFYKNSDRYVLGNFDDYFDSILRLVQSDSIEVFGFYDEEEMNSSEFANLGLARASILKELLINRGLDSGRISLYSSIRNLEFRDSLAVTTSIDKSAHIDLVSEVVQIVVHHGMTEVYFPTNSDDEIASEELNKFLADLVQSSKHKKVRLIGHTDDTGNEEANLDLSLRRTHTMRDRLKKLGMSEANIECIGKGSSDPRVKNFTAENRALNRRVEIIVQ